MNREAINIADFETTAKDKLSQMVYDYYAGGAHDEITLRANRRAYERLSLYYRVLRNVENRCLKTSVLGQDLDFPLLVSPTAFHQMAHEHGELATARAVARAGSIMILSTLSNTDIDDVAKAAGGRLWFQLYVYKDREVTKALMERAESAGCKAIVLTVDAPLWGTREKDVRNGFMLPENLSIKNLTLSGKEKFPETLSGSGLAAYVNEMFDPGVTWRDLEWLCNSTRLPVLVKGLVHPLDARQAKESGARGIIVSNHGGRQLDTAPATIDALPGIADAVGDKVELIVDGGVRRGTDIIKALALGASAVGIGRPALWGLASDGEKGVCGVLNLFKAEFDQAMGLCGYSSVDKIEPIFNTGKK